MIRQLEISKGVEPVKAFSDIKYDIIQFDVDGKIYTFTSADMPFTLRNYTADKALILKHADKSIPSPYDL